MEIQVVNTIVLFLTPLIGGIVAWKLAALGNELTHGTWANQKLIEKRLKFYDDVVPVLNDLHCFYGYFGHWKEQTPPEIIQKKRFLDKAFHVYGHLFKSDIIGSYDSFSRCCFSHYQGKGEDAKIRASFSERKKLDGWNSDWDSMFDTENKNRREVNLAYQSLILDIRKDLGVKRE